MTTVEGLKDAGYIQFLPLYRAIDAGDWQAAEKFLAENPGALTANLSENEDKPLHVAVLAGKVDIVAQLVNQLDIMDLELKNENGSTALIHACTAGTTEIAQLLIGKNPNLITIPDKRGQIPIAVASMYGHKDMVKKLYIMTPKDELSPEKGKNGALVLTSCIMGDMFDIALDLLKHHRRLAVTQDTEGDIAADMLAQKPSAFPSGSTLRHWQRWIYSLICIHSHQCLCNTNGDIEKLHNESTSRRNMITKGLYKLVGTLCDHLKDFVPAIKYIYNLKLSHIEAKELLICICEEISTYRSEEFNKIGVSKAVFNAVKHGIVEFVEELIKQYPDIVWMENKNEEGIFLYAAKYRQEKIFSLIYKMDAKKGYLATIWGKNINILREAAELAPPSQLDRITGAALQMQRELQWFKEMEDFVLPKYKGMIDKEGNEPLRVVFTEKHKDLKKTGEEWLKKTAESSTLVAALIATIMFSAAFTIPGGIDDRTGDPKYLGRNYFMIFLISDAVSLFASSTSLLIFLGILTARYRDEDFLIYLPTRLIIGLSTLFFSIAAMMVTFGITLVMTIRQRVPWVSFPIILFGSLPVVMFAIQQYPLLIEMVWSTYGPGIFDKPNKRWGFMSRKMSKS